MNYILYIYDSLCSYPYNFIPITYRSNSYSNPIKTIYCGYSLFHYCIHYKKNSSLSNLGNIKWK